MLLKQELKILNKQTWKSRIYFNTKNITDFTYKFVKYIQYNIIKKILYNVKIKKKVKEKVSIVTDKT